MCMEILHLVSKLVEKAMERKNFERAKESLQGHLHDLGDTEKTAKKMMDEAEKFETRMKNMEAGITRLQENEIKTNEKMEKLQKTNDYLVQKMEEIASNFENSLAKYIYPQDTSIGQVFSNLMLWLNKNKDTPEGQKASTKWDKFKTKVGWEEEHEIVLNKMLKCLMTLEHQAIGFEPKFSYDEKRYIEDIRSMIQHLELSSS